MTAVVISEPIMGIVPVGARHPDDLDRLARCLVSVRSTAPALALLVAETGWSDPELTPAVVAASDELGIVHAPYEGESPSIGQAVGGGMRVAVELGHAAVVVDPDVELRAAGWLERLIARTDSHGRPAAVVGARTVYDGDVVDQVGMYFSLYERRWRPRYRCAPALLPAALAPERCPVAAGVVLVRLHALRTIGGYDPGYTTGQAELDICLRAFAAGLECVVEPAVEAVRLRRPGSIAAFPAAALRATEAHLLTTHWETDMTAWVPAVL